MLRFMTERVSVMALGLVSRLFVPAAGGRIELFYSVGESMLGENISPTLWTGRAEVRKSHPGK
jgi:hypothetical protein